MVMQDLTLGRVNSVALSPYQEKRIRMERGGVLSCMMIIQ